MLSSNTSINTIEAALEDLGKAKQKDALEPALSLAQSILRLFVSESLPQVEDIVAEGLLQLPNAERQDSWFMAHPWMDGAKSAFEIFDGLTIPIQAKFFWLKKKTTAHMAGSVHFTANWEDFEYTRQSSDYKVGIDFFLSPDAKSFYIVLSSSGKLRVMELSESLNRTQAETLERWRGLVSSNSQSELHSALWDSFQLQSVNSLFYSGVSDAFLELVDTLIKSGKDEQDAKLFASRLLGRLIFVWFLRKMKLISEAAGYFAPESFRSDTDYYKQALERLFFRTLNEPLGNRSTADGTLDLDTPYLNGGLFAPHENDWEAATDLQFPTSFFSRLFEHFSNFNFTVDESTPDFEQVAVDPEMLGRVFESLLATQVEETGEQARKAKGTFYTPREVVFYMCRESIAKYLASKRPGDESYQNSVRRLLDTSDQDWAKAGTNSLRDIPKGHREALLEAIEELKTLDPACGSGAFPLGLLAVLTKCVMRLLPEANAYQVKSKILANSIFGSDIEPMAVEISKLRAWLSLIVEESKDARGVEPLPNLEFKFVCANSLIHLANKGEINLFDSGEIEEELQDIRDRYFETKDPAKKAKLRDRFNKAVDGEKVLFGETKRSTQLRTFRPFEDNSVASYFDAENMFGVMDFDIVIGNPPYVNVEKIDPAVKVEARERYVTAFQKYDLYVLFFERGLELLSPSGVIAFITSNKYLSQGYGKELRKMLLTKTITNIVNFELNIFDSAVVRTCILIAENCAPKGSEVRVNNILDKTSARNFWLENYSVIPQSELPSGPDLNFRLTLNPGKNRVLDKIISSGLHLEEYCSIHYGLRPSAKDSSFKKSAVISNEAKVGWKMYFEGKHMGYWSVRKHQFLNFQPDVMYNPMFPELFSNPKIVGIRTLSDIGKMRFVFDGNGLYCNDSVIVANLWYLLEGVKHSSVVAGITDERVMRSKTITYEALQAILNSNVLRFVAQELTYDGTHFYPNHMKSLPIPHLESDISRALHAAAVRARDYENSAATEELKQVEDEIDDLVCQSFGLTAEDKKLILDSLAAFPIHSP